MKTVSDNLPLFSAYPLKALNLSEEEYQSEIKLWEHTNSMTTGDLRVQPMVNPYKAKDFPVDQVISDNNSTTV